MRSIFKIGILFLPMLFFINGCMVISKMSDKQVAEKKTQAARVDKQPDGKYYFFTQSHIKRKQGDFDQAVSFMKKAIEKDDTSLYLKRELAALYLLKKDSKSAIEVVVNIIKKNPDDIQALLILGRIKHSLNLLDEAAAAYEKVIQLDSAQRNTYLLLGNIYMGKKKWGDAERVYSRLIKQFPGSYAGFFYLGKLSKVQGKTDKAKLHFLKTLELEPKLEESRFELSEIYESENNLKKALDSYNQILKINHTSIKAGLNAGYLYWKLGMENEADTVLATLAQRSLSEPEIIRNIVRDYIDKKAFDKSIAILETMLKFANDSSELQYLAGAAKDGKGDKQGAIRHFEKVKPKTRFFQNAAVHASILYQELDKLDLAIAFLKNSIAKSPGFPDFYLYLGSFYEQKEKFDEAQAVLLDGLEIDKDHSRLHFRLGVVLDKMEKKEASIAQMKTVIKLDPKNASALNYLGYTYADMGKNLKEAERLVLEALKHKPDDGYITDSLGWVYYKMGLYKKALPLLEKAALLVPDDPIVLEHLGDIHAKMNANEKAIKYYDLSIKKGNKEKASVEKKISSLRK